MERHVNSVTRRPTVTWGGCASVTGLLVLAFLLWSLTHSSEAPLHRGGAEEVVRLIQVGRLHPTPDGIVMLGDHRREVGGFWYCASAWLDPGGTLNVFFLTRQTKNLSLPRGYLWAGAASPTARKTVPRVRSAAYSLFVWDGKHEHPVRVLSRPSARWRHVQFRWL